MHDNIRDLQKHLEKIEKKRNSEIDSASNANFSDFKPEHGYMPQPPGNSMKYSYSITNKNSVDSRRPKFGQGPFRANDDDNSEISGIQHIQKQNNIVSFSFKKEKVNSEKIFKKNSIKHFNIEQGNQTTSLFKPQRNELLDLSEGQLVSENPAHGISNLADESMGVSKNGFSDILKYQGRSKGSDRVVLFEDNDEGQFINM
jgi:hypothetical protein